MAADRPIYLDHHATTPCDARVVKAMLPYFGERFGNAASRSHRFGWEADRAVEAARAAVAALVGVEPQEIVFTSGATEANNLALKGMLAALGQRGRHLVVSAVEHSSVREVAAWLAERGLAEVSWVAPDAEGRVAPDAVADRLRPDTVLVSVIHANNEVGTVNPVAGIAAVCRRHGVFFHTDAAQSAGRIPLDLKAAGVDLASLSAHKLYGPKGVGALYVRRGRPRVRPEPLLHGGGHEGGLRPGTLPVPLIVGFGRAAGLAAELMPAEAERLAALRDRLQRRILAEVEGVRLNGAREGRLPGNLHLSFEGVAIEPLLLALRELAVSTGAACSSARPEPSHVLRAMGVPDALARASIRFGLGRSNTPEEIERAADRVRDEVRRLRSTARGSR